MARRFNGTSDKIVYSHIAAWDGRSSLSVSIWVSPNAFGGADWYPRVIGQEDSGTANGWGIGHEENLPDFPFFFVRNADTFPALLAGNQWDIGTYKHTYMMFDGSQGTAADRVKVWLDGSPLTLTPVGTNPATIGTTTAAFQLGTTPGNATGFFAGDLAEIGIWHDADDSRIADLAAGNAPSFFQTNLHVYLPLLESGDAEDVKGNAGSATVTGTTAVAHPAGITYPATRRYLLMRA